MTKVTIPSDTEDPLFIQFMDEKPDELTEDVWEALRESLLQGDSITYESAEDLTAEDLTPSGPVMPDKSQPDPTPASRGTLADANVDVSVRLRRLKEQNAPVAP